jgi:hypothetical protein
MEIEVVVSEARGAGGHRDVPEQVPGREIFEQKLRVGADKTSEHTDFEELKNPELYGEVGGDARGHPEEPHRGTKHLADKIGKDAQEGAGGARCAALVAGIDKAYLGSHRV